jgi:hypothetical protein
MPSTPVPSEASREPATAPDPEACVIGVDFAGSAIDRPARYGVAA